MKRIVNASPKLSWATRACAVMVLCATMGIALPAQTLTTLFRFDIADGMYPEGTLVQATNGDFYGTTNLGPGQHGTVFKIRPGGTLTTLHRFCSQRNCTDGSNPAAGLVQATNGNFYGTTYGGGDLTNCSGGCGAVFKMTPSGTLTTLYSFCSHSGCLDGESPDAGLVQATDGDFYGTTAYGGANIYGTIFKITPSGALTTLYSFCAQSGCPDGRSPSAGLVQATDGDFYGTTAYGGANSCTIVAPNQGCGTVFKITPSGTLTTLYSFCHQTGCPDGSNPFAGLVQATGGDFYGTTVWGGANACPPNGCGTIFKITTSGTFTTLHTFCLQTGCTDGSGSDAALVQVTDGDLYGTSAGGGANLSGGTIFKIAPSGALTTLYSFCAQSGCPDGEGPSGLVQATNGDFYGTTLDRDGTVFSFSVGLGPFLETRPTSGKAGRFVEMLGTNLTGATSVSFNGTAAAFTVVSQSLISTTVPAGASTGEVQVVTPGGTLSSNVPFRVLP